MERLGGVDKLAAQALFYRIFSGILAARMRECNIRMGELEDRVDELEKS